MHVLESWKDTPWKDTSARSETMVSTRVASCFYVQSWWQIFLSEVRPKKREEMETDRVGD